MSFLQQKNNHHKLLKKNYKNLIFVIIAFLFIVANGTSAKNKLNLEKNKLKVNEINFEKYHFKVKVSAKDKTNLMNFTPSDLTWPKENEVSMPKNSAWIFNNGKYIWKPGGKSQSVKIPLKQNKVIKKSSLDRLDEIQIDYQDLFLDNPILPSVKLAGLKTKPFPINKKNLSQKKVFIFENHFPKETLNISSAIWKKKDILYLIQRTLGLNHSPIWRFSKDRHRTVFQRPFHKDLQSIEAIDLIINDNVDKNALKKIACNFRVSHTIKNLSNPSEPTYVLHGGNPFDTYLGLPLNPIFFKAQGKTVLRYRIGNFIRQTYENKKVTYLHEVIIFFPGSLKEITRMRPVESISFIGRTETAISFFENEKKQPKFSNKSTPIFNHTLQTQVLSRNTKRLIIKFPEGINITNIDTNLESIGLLFRPTNPNLKSGFRLQRAKKITRNDSEIQSIFAADTKASRRWGGPFINRKTNDPKFERIQINSLFSFQNFDNNTPISSRGITIQTKKPFSHWRSMVNGLELEGKGKWIEIDWPVEAYLEEDTLFYIEISKGVEMVSSMQIIPFIGKHRLKSISAIPNQSVRLNLPKKNITKLKLLFKLYEEHPFKLVLRKMALFQPILVTESEAIDMSPDWISFPLMEVQGKQIFPVSVMNLTAEEIISRKHWLDLGIHSIDATTLNTQRFRFPDHPYLKTISVLAQKFTPQTIFGQESVLKKANSISVTDKNLWEDFFRTIFFILGSLAAIRWLWNTDWWLTKWGAFKEKTYVVRKCANKYLLKYQIKPGLFWLTLAGGVYLIGTLALLYGISIYSFFNILSFGSLAMVPVWNHWIKGVQPKIEKKWPRLAKTIYAEEVTQYISGFFVCLIPVTLFRIFHLDSIAEQFAIIGFYLLVMGIFLKVKNIFKTQHKPFKI